MAANVLPLTDAQIAMIQRAVREVVTGPGYGTVSIIIEGGEPKLVQQTVSHFIRQRGEHSPPLNACRAMG